MRQAVMTSPGTIEHRDVDAPAAGRGQVLLRIRRIGVCGSDVHVFKGEHPIVQPPLDQGHDAGVLLEGQRDVELVGPLLLEGLSGPIEGAHHRHPDVTVGIGGVGEEADEAGGDEEASDDDQPRVHRARSSQPSSTPCPDSALFIPSRIPEPPRKLSVTMITLENPRTATCSQRTSAEFGPRT